jgi:serine/threonine-protein kinase
MLSASPEARGSAREMAEALEHAVREAAPEADVPLFVREVSRSVEAQAARPVEARAAPWHVPRHAPKRSRWSWLTAASLGGALALGAGWMLSTHPGEEAETVRASAPEEGRDGGTVAVGDSVLTAPVPLCRAPFAWSTIAVDLPPRPLPGQRRPDANGRCPLKEQVAINGGCWIKLNVDLKACGEEGYIHEGGCYVPSIPPARPPTSRPANRPEDAP